MAIVASTDGSSTYVWSPVKVKDSAGADTVTDLVLPCFLDLSFVRKGKDTLWVEAAGRPKDRTGVIFFGKGAFYKVGVNSFSYVESGMRIDMTRGPSGAFSIEGALDEAWTPRKRHHLEFGVIEVASVVKRAEFVA